MDKVFNNKGIIENTTFISCWSRRQQIFLKKYFHQVALLSPEEGKKALSPHFLKKVVPSFLDLSVACVYKNFLMLLIV